MRPQIQSIKKLCLRCCKNFTIARLGNEKSLACHLQKCHLYLRQKCELNKTSTDSSSSRPSNMAKLNTPSWKGFRPP